MSNIDDGGAAFPAIDPPFSAGLSMRDYFAGQVIGSLIVAVKGTGINHETLANDASDAAYMIADAMIERRKPKTPQN